MAAVRAWHRPLRLAAMCAALAMAGGGPAMRAAYAEVSTPALTQLLAARASHRAQGAPLPPSVAIAPSRVAARITFPVAPLVPLAPLYLSHCALLL